MKLNFFPFLLLGTVIISCKKQEVYVPTVSVTSFTPVGNPGLNDIVFTGSDTGYVSCSTGVVLKTTDGGINWVNVQVGPADYDMQYLSFINSRIGFVSGGNTFGRRLYKTTDAGVTWTLLGSSFDYNEIEFVDQNIGYMIHLNELYKTTNGGTIWNLSNALSNLFAPENVVFMNKDTGFVRDRGGFFYWTTNGGTSINVNTNSTSSSLFVSFAKKDRRNGIGFTETSAFSTSDAGQTWNQLGSWSQNYSTYAFNCRGSYVITSGDRALVVSKDGGQTFTNYYNQDGVSILDDLKKNFVTASGTAFCLGASGKIYRITF